MNVQVETLETRLRMMEVKIERLEKEILQINSGIEKMTFFGGFKRYGQPKR